MYMVEIYLNSDGDFGYQDSEFGITDDSGTSQFFFDNRESAIEATKRFFDSLATSFHTSRLYMENLGSVIRKLSFEMDDICKETETFEITKDSGNACFEFRLVEVKERKLKNGAVTYDRKSVEGRLW